MIRMHDKVNVTSITFAALISSALMLVACGDKAPPEEIVKQKVLERWAIRTNGKIDGLYKFLSPSRRQVIERVAYERQFGGAVKYLGAKVKSVNCQGENPSEYEVCQVKVYVDFETLGAHITKAGTLIEETWVREDQQWWYADK